MCILRNNSLTFCPVGRNGKNYCVELCENCQNAAQILHNTVEDEEAETCLGQFPLLH